MPCMLKLWCAEHCVKEAFQVILTLGCQCTAGLVAGRRGALHQDDASSAGSIHSHNFSVSGALDDAANSSRGMGLPIAKQVSYSFMMTIQPTLLMSDHSHCAVFTEQLVQRIGGCIGLERVYGELGAPSEGDADLDNLMKGAGGGWTVLFFGVPVQVRRTTPAADSGTLQRELVQCIFL